MYKICRVIKMNTSPTKTQKSRNSDAGKVLNNEHYDQQRYVAEPDIIALFSREEHQHAEEQTIDHTVSIQTSHHCGYCHYEGHLQGGCHGHSLGMDIALGWTQHWAGHSIGLDIALGWTQHWAGHSLGMDIALGWTQPWDGHSIGLDIALGRTQHWAGHSIGLDLALGWTQP